MTYTFAEVIYFPLIRRSDRRSLVHKVNDFKVCWLCRTLCKSCARFGKSSSTYTHTRTAAVTLFNDLLELETAESVPGDIFVLVAPSEPS